MLPTKTRDATNNCDKPLDWDAEKMGGDCSPLEVRREAFPVDDKSQVVKLTSTWKPTAEELVAINSGGVIEITLYRPDQCVMQVGVVEPI